MYRAFLLTLAGAFSLVATAAVADDTALAYSHTLRKEGGRTCMADHFHSGSGAGRSKEAARAAAVRSWIDFTNFEYGTVWARFGAAASPSIHYTRAGAPTWKRVPARADRPTHLFRCCVLRRARCILQSAPRIASPVVRHPYLLGGYHTRSMLAPSGIAPR